MVQRPCQFQPRFLVDGVSGPGVPPSGVPHGIPTRLQSTASIATDRTAPGRIRQKRIRFLPLVTTDRKHLLKRIAPTTGRALLWLVRLLLALLLAIGRWLFLRAIPATWRWLRYTAFPLLRRLYLRLPHRRVVAACAGGVVAIAVLLTTLLPGADDTAFGVTARQPAKVRAREAELVDRLLSGDWAGQKAATRSVLASAGVTVLADDAPVPAAGGLHVISPELTVLAMDVAGKRTRGRLTLADVAMMLEDAGFPFAQDRSPIRSMEDGMRMWVRSAIANPERSGAETALFLHAMASRQTPALDLSSDLWTAEQHYLTHLELLVLESALVGLFPPPPGVGPDSPAIHGGMAFFLDMVVPQAHAADTVCGEVKDYYDHIGKRGAAADPMSTALDMLEQLVLDGAALRAGGLRKSLGKGDSSASKALGKALSALDAVLKLQKLAMLYESIDMRVTADHSLVHKPIPDEGGREVVFTAQVGVDEEKYKELMEQRNTSEISRLVKECAALVGAPMPADIEDISKEVKDWDVSWDRCGDHATWSQKKTILESGKQRRMPLTMVSPRRGEARFVVDINKESHHDGDILTGYINAKATLHTDKAWGEGVAESAKSALDSIKRYGMQGPGGLSKGLAELFGVVTGLVPAMGTELASIWIQRILDPEVYYNVAVTYHQHRYPGYSYEGTVEAQTEFSENKTERRKGKRNSSGRLGIGNEDSTHTSRLQERGKLTVQGMRPTYMAYTRYTERKDTASWEMSGDGDFSGAFSLFKSTAGQRGCAGVKAPEHYFQNLYMASDSTSTPQTYSMSIEQVGSRDDGYRIQLSFAGAGGLIVHEVHTSEHHGAGCEFAAPEGFTHDNRFWNSRSIGLSGAAYEYEISEPYPETISGTTSVDNGNGSKTTWKWNFRRVGPIDNATGKVGEMGGS